MRMEIRERMGGRVRNEVVVFFFFFVVNRKCTLCITKKRTLFSLRSEEREKENSAKRLSVLACRGRRHENQLLIPGCGPVRRL